MIFFFPECFSPVRTCVKVYVGFFLSLCRREVYSALNIYKILLLLAVKRENYSKETWNKRKERDVGFRLGELQSTYELWKGKKKDFVYTSKS